MLAHPHLSLDIPAAPAGLAGLSAAELHGNLTQTQRLHALEQFRDGKTDFLLATDLAGRGLALREARAVAAAVGAEVTVRFMPRDALSESVVIEAMRGSSALPESTGAKITDQTTDQGKLADSVHQTQFNWDIIWQYFSLWF